MVISSVDEKNHQHFQDLVGGAALGILTAEEHAELMAHIATCAACLQELSEFSAVVELIPLSLDEESPSPTLRNRMQMRIQSELSLESPNARGVSTIPVGYGRGSSQSSSPFAAAQEGAPPVDGSARPRRRELAGADDDHDFVPIPIDAVKRSRRRPSPLFWSIAAIALVAIISGALIGRYFLANNGQNNEDQGQQIALNFSPTVTSNTAKLTYFPKTDLLVFSASDLPPTPEGHVYQVWLIANKTPQPMGTIGPNGFATVADLNNFDAFAVTVEPGPLGSTAPTTKPFITAPLKPATS